MHPFAKVAPRCRVFLACCLMLLALQGVCARTPRRARTSPSPVPALAAAAPCVCSCPSPSPSPSPPPSPPPSAGTTYYVNAGTGSDTSAGTSSTAAWKTLTKVSTWAGNPGFKPGDTILLSGQFTGTINIQLDKTYGSPSNPITIASLNPAAPATIAPLGNNAIFIWTPTATAAGGLGLLIRDLILTGNKALTSGGKTTAGVMLWHDGPSQVEFLEIRNVVASGFTEAGICTFRNTGTPQVRDVRVLNTVAWGNPGYLGVKKPAGSGIVLSGVKGGLIQNCTAYANGGANDNTGGGPVGIWAYDADSVTIRNCTSRDNRSLKNDGGGFDLDGGSTNCVIENCVASNNHGYGYLFCAWGGFNTYNVTVRNSVTTNDGWGITGMASTQVWTASGSVSSVGSITLATFQNMTVNINTTSCTQWTNNWKVGSALGVYGNFFNVRWLGNTINCAGPGGSNTITNDIACDFASNPNCV